mmetsp:Transcript_22443/g.19938  ORF Transcript_22443/g.19938 Transcript_22443/m.19938 type:complete len:192 (-) Transcript_22443:307-882(-)
MKRIAEIFNVNTFIVSQVNPFVIPFINDDGGGILGTQSSYVGTFKTLLGNEVIHWANQISFLGLIPAKLSNLIGLLNQNYKGHVTISPRVRLSDFINILRNPTPDFVKETSRRSEQNIYTKISMIKALYATEREIKILYESVKSLHARDEEAGSKISFETEKSNQNHLAAPKSSFGEAKVIEGKFIKKSRS